MGEKANITGMMFRCKSDAALSITFADEGSRMVVGYTPAELVDTGFLSLPDLIHPDERDNVRSIIQAGLTAKKTFVIWTRLQVKDRAPAEGIIIGSGTFNGPLSLVGIEGYIVRVLSAPERTIAGDTPSPEICLDLLSHIEELVVLLTDDGIISYITPSVSRLLGKTKAAVTGLPFSQTLHPGDQKRFEEFRAQVITGGGSSGRFGLYLPDGELRHLFIRAYKPGNLAGVILNISRDDLSSGSEEEKEPLYQDLFTRLPVPTIITTAVDMRILDINHTASALALLSPVKQIGLDLRETGIISTEIIEQIREGLSIADQIERSDSHGDGESFQVLAREVQVKNQDLIIWTLISGQTISEKSGTGEPGELSRETRHSYVNHLQTLRTIFSRKQLSAAAEPEDFMRYGKLFLDSVIQLYEAGGGKGGRISICQYLRRMVELINEEYTEELVDIELTIQCPKEDHLPEKTANILGIITTELVLNAINHAFEPGQAGRIEIALLQEEDWNIFQVQDTGKGLPESVIRAGSKTSGFNLIENLVMELSGTMTLANDGGAVVRVVFPVGTKEP